MRINKIHPERHYSSDISCCKICCVPILIIVLVLEKVLCCCFIETKPIFPINKKSSRIQDKYETNIIKYCGKIWGSNKNNGINSNPQIYTKTTISI